MKGSSGLNICGKFLIAMPDMGDPRFEKSVIYICSHDSSGAMGLRIDKPKGPLTLIGLLPQIGIDGPLQVADTPVLEGGPVDIDRGFILHTADFFNPELSVRLSETLALSSTKDALQALTSPQAPDQAVLAIGYSGWGPGQLELEISENVWIVSDAKESLIFDCNTGSKWHRALALMGISPETLSCNAGNA